MAARTEIDKQETLFTLLFQFVGLRAARRPQEKLFKSFGLKMRFGGPGLVLELIRLLQKKKKKPLWDGTFQWTLEKPLG